MIGGANIDIKAKTIGPQVAATSNPSHISTKPGGVGRNIAHNLAKLGVKVSLISAVGENAAGHMLLDATKAAGVDVSLILKTKQATGTYIAFLNDNGELITAANDMAIMQDITPELIMKHKAAIALAKFVVADCNLAENTLAAIAALAAEKLIIEPVSVSKAQKLKTLGRVFLATPNLDQIEALTGTRGPQAAAKILHKNGVKNLVIHAGENGAFVCSALTVTHIKSHSGKIIDVTGAGDAATAGLICGLVNGLSLLKAAELGQKVAAEVIASESSTLS